MCGRYSLTITKKALDRRFPVADGHVEHRPRYNIAPGQDAPVVVPGEGGHMLAGMRWGWPLAKASRLLTNARSESLTARTLFNRRLDGYRCLVPADGFYEWAPVEGRKGKQPFRIRMPDASLFAMAGLWRPGENGGAGGFLILTTASVGPLAALHTRAPVLLRPADQASWLDRSIPFRDVRVALDPALVADAVIEPVGPAVNRAGYDDPDCIRPIRLSRSGLLFETGFKRCGEGGGKA